MLETVLDTYHKHHETDSSQTRSETELQGNLMQIFKTCLKMITINAGITKTVVNIKTRDANDYQHPKSYQANASMLVS